MEKAEMDKWEYDAVIEEFQILTSIDNPNVIRVYCFYETDEKFYIVQELAKGGELFDELEKHEAHLPQRPQLENILLDDTRNYEKLKVIDFGLAAKVEPGDRLFEMVGKPRYIAPEVLGDDGYDLKYDIWSAGVTAYTLMAGYHPFEADHDVEVYQQIVDGYFDFKGPEWETVSDQAKDFVSKLLTYKDEERPTAEEALSHPWITGDNSGVPFAAAEPQIVWSAVELRRKEELQQLDDYIRVEKHRQQVHMTQRAAALRGKDSPLIFDRVQKLSARLGKVKDENKSLKDSANAISRETRKLERSTLVQAHRMLKDKLDGLKKFKAEAKSTLANVRQERTDVQKELEDTKIKADKVQSQRQALVDCLAAVSNRARGVLEQTNPMLLRAVDKITSGKAVQGAATAKGSKIVSGSNRTGSTCTDSSESTESSDNPNNIGNESLSSIGHESATSMGQSTSIIGQETASALGVNNNTSDNGGHSSVKLAKETPRATTSEPKNDNTNGFSSKVSDKQPGSAPQPKKKQSKVRKDYSWQNHAETEGAAASASASTDVSCPQLGSGDQKGRKVPTPKGSPKSSKKRASVSTDKAEKKAADKDKPNKKKSPKKRLSLSESTSSMGADDATPADKKKKKSLSKEKASASSGKEKSSSGKEKAKKNRQQQLQRTDSAPSVMSGDEGPDFEPEKKGRRAKRRSSFGSVPDVKKIAEKVAASIEEDDKEYSWEQHGASMRRANTDTSLLNSPKRELAPRRNNSSDEKKKSDKTRKSKRR
ncbi:expressed unknown protein [Seminavis robusta]|uniref:Protein kinase domain-containing protein n=1 Tax=Seminavis robusta TaxID=568900 RepID=A0A9N8EX60_9STRA|nr:expressed unknown protein [Seminavis robusta]|eukprot:Sro1868_g302600.2  (766) ;mRNA; f:7271-9886